MVAKKLMDDDDEVAVISLAKTRNNLSFKKRKTKGALVDLGHALEDTASSPVNSPKVRLYIYTFRCHTSIDCALFIC